MHILERGRRPAEERGKKETERFCAEAEVRRRMGELKNKPTPEDGHRSDERVCTTRKTKYEATETRRSGGL